MPTIHFEHSRGFVPLTYGDVIELEKRQNIINNIKKYFHIAQDGVAEIIYQFMNKRNIIDARKFKNDLSKPQNINLRKTFIQHLDKLIKKHIEWVAFEFKRPYPETSFRSYSSKSRPLTANDLILSKSWIEEKNELIQLKNKYK